jgi:hypothetical protein
MGVDLAASMHNLSINSKITLRKPHEDRNRKIDPERTNTGRSR